MIMDVELVTTVRVPRWFICIFLKTYQFGDRQLVKSMSRRNC